MSYQKLNFLLKNGLILEKVHSAVSFCQKPWLKDYIMYVAKLRCNAKENSQDFFNLVMKSLATNTFGKFCENPENYRCIEMARSAEQLKNLCSSPNFIKQHILSDNLVLCEMIPEKCLFKFQYAVASTILDLSKLFMYEFWYETLLPHFHPDVPELLMTDTDSVFFSIECENFIAKYKTLPKMDFSNFAKDNVLFNTENKMKLLHFKDEFPYTNFITEFIGLRAKLYCYRTMNSKGVHTDFTKSKGYNKHAASQNLNFQKFKQCHDSFKTMKFSYRTFRSIEWSLHTIEQMKNVLSNFDSKMYVHSCNVHASFYGSSKNKSLNSDCYICNQSSIHFPLKISNEEI